MSVTVLCQDQSGTTDPPGGSTSVAGRTACEIRSHESDGVVVLEPLGQLDRAGVEQVLHAALAVADRAVVIDLSACVLTHPHALADLTGDGFEPVDLCFVSRRPTCRLLLARTGITSRFAVFHQREDALQARIFASAGYGRGWRRTR